MLTTQLLDILELQEHFNGELIVPGNAAYDAQRKLWNGMIDKFPAVIARCSSTTDVAQAVRFARANYLTIAVRGGGHNVAGFATVDGGMVIDLSMMTQVQVDAENRTARVAGGATLRHIDHATQPFGLAVPAGVVSATGIAGLTLGGGMGWLRRKYGLTCDNMLAAEVVTASGEIVRASDTENPDLLWGLRGGGGNFGIVTAFEFRLHPVGPEVAFTFVLYPLEAAKAVLRAHEAFLQSDSQGDVSTLIVMGFVPPAAPFPEDLHGKPFIGLLGVYAGDAGIGMDVMQPLREITPTLLDLSGVMPFTDVQQIYDEDYPNGKRYYWKSVGVQQLSDEMIDLMVTHTLNAPSHHSTIDLWYHGGAVATPDAKATAYGRRDIPYLVNTEANWDSPEDDSVNINWARDFLEALKPYSENSLYLNFPGMLEDGDNLVRAAFGENYARLVALKTKYDPENTFSRNQNIKPATLVNA
jgi:FAD/FMN-containing dehydrogenase